MVLAAILMQLCACTSALSQAVPQLINYQGQILLDDGLPVETADYVLTFRIYETAEGGDAPVWGPQIFDGASGPGHGARVPVVKGYFNVMIGPHDTASPPRSLGSAFGADMRYMEIQVGTNLPIRPRQQILSAPFAFRANSAEFAATAGAVRSAALTTTADGAVGIGTARPLGRLDVVAEAGGPPDFERGSTGVLRVGGTGPQHIEFGFEGNRTWIQSFGAVPLHINEGGNDIILNSGPGSVGIGVTTPRAKLEVGGTVLATRFVGPGAVPPGSIIAFGGGTEPTGWLSCDGRAVSRTEFEDLFNAIGIAWGSGNGTTTFNVPDLRGYFLRGQDRGAGRDPDSSGRTPISSGNSGDKVGSYQWDALRSHGHTFTGTAVAVGGWGAGAGGRPLSTGDPNNWGEYRPQGTISPTGDNETRPKNAYVNYIIKF